MTDILREGYVGITCDPKRRFIEHKQDARSDNWMKREEFREQLLTSKVEMKIIVIGSREYCIGVEKNLRPEPLTGWNVARGGGSHSENKLGREYYSEKLKTWKTLREWADYSGKTYEEVRHIIRGRQLSIDHAIGLKKLDKGGWRYNFSKDDEIAALYYFENTAMMKTPILNKVGWTGKSSDFFRDIKVPKYILDYVDMPFSTGLCTIRIKRQQSITNFTDIEKAYDMWFFEGASVADISRTIKFPYETTKKLILCLEDGV